MSELQQLISQQVSLLQKQNELQQTCINEQKKYIEHLEQRNTALIQQMNQVPKLDLSDSLQKFGMQAQKHLQEKLLTVLDNSNIEKLVQSKINQELKPMLDDIQLTQSQLTKALSTASSLNTVTSNEINASELNNKLQNLELSVKNLIEQLNTLI